MISQIENEIKLVAILMSNRGAEFVTSFTMRSINEFMFDDGVLILAL